MPPSLRDAYDIIGLQPFGEFLDTSLADRRMGSTTWMLVEAALAALGGANVIIVAETLIQSETLAKTCLGYIMKLQASTMAVRQQTKGPDGRFYDLEFGGTLGWVSHRTEARFFRKNQRKDYKVFSDVEYRLMAMQRRDGPVGEIRKLVRDGNGYRAYDKRGEFLMDLTETGARQVADADPYRVVVEG